MPTLLLVEDDKTQAQLLSKALANDGWEVTVCGDGQEGLDKARQTLPELIILDINLPSLDGLSVCRILYRDSTTTNIPIIILTARAMEVDKIVGLESGAIDYQVKPVLLGEFLARARSALRASARRSPAVTFVESKDLKIDLLAQKLYVSGEETTIPLMQYKLLAYFMQKKGVVLSRGAILTDVWGESAFVDPRTVDVHVRWLREKIEEDSSDPRRIQTVRSIGYRFEG